MALEMSPMEGGISRLQSLAGLGFGVGGAPRELGSLWRWGALLLLAVLATYGSLIARARLLLRRLHSHLCKTALPQPQRQQHLDDDDDTCSSCSSDDTCSTLSEEVDVLSAEEADAAEEQEKEVVRRGYFGDYPAHEGRGGGFHLQGGREVVKAWGASDLRFDGSSAALGCVLSLCELDRGEIVRPFVAGNGRGSAAASRAVSTPPAVVLSAGDTACGRRVELRLWDARVGGRTPAAFVELSPRLRRRVQRIGGAGKVVYLGDGAGSAAAVDLRRVRSPVGRVAEDEATWWDADAVVLGGADVAGFLQEGAPSSTATRRFRPLRK